jgi:hypothetical protein
VDVGCLLNRLMLAVNCSNPQWCAYRDTGRPDGTNPKGAELDEGRSAVNVKVLHATSPMTLALRIWLTALFRGLSGMSRLAADQAPEVLSGPGMY